MNLEAMATKEYSIFARATLTGASPSDGLITMYVSLTIRLKSFVYTQLNDQTVLFLTIQFSISFVCTHF